MARVLAGRRHGDSSAKKDVLRVSRYRLSADLDTWLLIGAGGEELLSQQDPVAATETLGRQRYFGW
jgi:hypothetical protein